MKLNELKKIFKEVVKEAFREEMKDLLLEAVRSNKGTEKVMSEVQYNSPHPHTPQPSINKDELRNQFLRLQEESVKGKRSYEGEMDVNSMPTINPFSDYALPEGEVSLNQITNLLKG